MKMLIPLWSKGYAMTGMKCFMLQRWTLAFPMRKYWPPPMIKMLCS